jgi:hypothetical protein
MSQPQPAHRWAKRVVVVLCVALTPVLLTAAVMIAFLGNANASSHREAPAIAKDAYADSTDVWTFISPENPDNIVLAGSWIPFEGPEGGPNYYEWDPSALYDIYVDTDGDASPNVTYTLSSRVDTLNGETFLYNVGPINDLNTNWNRPQYVTITEQIEGGAVTPLVANKRTAPVNIGAKSTPNYSALESAAIWPAAGGTIKLFAGPTDDAFWVDLQVFDLLTLRGQAAPVGYGTGNNIPIDSLSGFNVHSLVIELPIARIKSGDDPVFGVWAATRRESPDVMVSNTHASYSQVSRLGMPLVNEVVVPLALKDAFNTLYPAQDVGLYTSGSAAGDLLQKSVEDPEVGRLLCALYAVPMPGDADDDCSTEVTVGTPRSGRGDIFDIFLTGMVLANPFTIQTANGPMELPADFNVNRPTTPGAQPAEMIRINTNIKGELCSPTPSRLGVLGGDACGFPNGRRLTDDVVDISLLAVAGAAYGVLDGRDADFTFNAGLIDVLDDGLNGNDVPFRHTFPYMAQAQSGQEHIHQNPILTVILPFISRVGLTIGELPGAQPLAGWSSLLFVTLVLPAMVLMRRRRQ